MEYLSRCDSGNIVLQPIDQGLRVFEHLQRERIVHIRLEAVSTGRHYRQGPSRRNGGVEKNGSRSIGKSRGGWIARTHRVAADVRTTVTFSLSSGQPHEALEGHKLLNRLGHQHDNPSLIMDRAYEANEPRRLALALAFASVVPPLSLRTAPWEYDREMCKRHNEVERLFRRLKGFRRVFTRFGKLDVVFLGFILFALNH